MERRNLRITSWLVLASILLSACGQAGTTTDTLELEQTQIPVTETPLPTSPASTTTLTPSPTVEPTPTPTRAPQISVIENSNCRTGPGEDFPFQGVLIVGEVAEVIGRSTSLDYWLVTNDQLPKVGCWLWGAYAQVEGDVEAIPMYTPIPSPTPQVGFELYVKSFVDCGYAKNVVFAVRNAGSERFWSGYVEVQKVETGGILYSARERHPFADSVQPACPPGHGNELWPGETRYIHVPISPDDTGVSAVGIITLCTADNRGGTCLTKYSYFYLK